MRARAGLGRPGRQPQRGPHGGAGRADLRHPRGPHLPDRGGRDPQGGPDRTGVGRPAGVGGDRRPDGTTGRRLGGAPPGVQGRGPAGPDARHPDRPDRRQQLQRRAPADLGNHVHRHPDDRGEPLLPGPPAVGAASVLPDHRGGPGPAADRRERRHRLGRRVQPGPGRGHPPGRHQRRGVVRPDRQRQAVQLIDRVPGPLYEPHRR